MPTKDTRKEKSDVDKSARKQNNRMDGILPIYILLTVFQSYQDDVWMLKGCVQFNLCLKWGSIPRLLGK